MMLREPWRTRLLFLSFAINLFAIALIAAHLAMRSPSPGPQRPDMIIERMARDLPPEDATRFRAAMAAKLPDIEIAHQRMDAAKAELSQAISRTPYDQAEVRRAMKDWQAAWVAMSDQLGAGVLAALSDLSPDGRQRLAEAGLRRPHR
ncbi:MAG TPA: periplasmic heavy metal sensor [Acetobacteraceae bacterium]|jgi:uncharacterized membrane protein|nr:periplasmic heavy metal sensor [Acetobacteraceae bacterium]